MDYWEALGGYRYGEFIALPHWFAKFIDKLLAQPLVPLNSQLIGLGRVYEPFTRLLKALVDLLTG